MPHQILMVVEADEYDRSFHQLSPHMAIITATDNDHLDIYQDRKTLLSSFSTLYITYTRKWMLVA